MAIAMSLCYFAIPTALIIYGIRLYNKSHWGVCKNDARLSGKIVIITGANSGIGYETAKELVRRGAKVIFACRNERLALKAIASISSELTEFIELDLASFSSILKFADAVKHKYGKVDVLINNAGVSLPQNQRFYTKDKLEMHFGVNYLGHYYLTQLLMDVLKESEHCRVINVSSLLHQGGTINLDDLNYDKGASNKRAYADSKLAQVYFGRELAKRMQGSSVRVYNVCPGWVYTNLFRHNVKNYFRLILAFPIACMYMRDSKMGAQTTIYCATEPSISNETGLLYRDCAHYESKHNFDDQIGVKLWDLSDAMVNRLK